MAIKMEKKLIRITVKTYALLPMHIFIKTLLYFVHQTTTGYLIISCSLSVSIVNWYEGKEWFITNISHILMTKFHMQRVGWSALHMPILKNVHTWKKVEEDIDEILVSPGNVVPVNITVWHHLFGPLTGPHTSQVHEHYPGVYSWQHSNKPFNYGII